MTNVLRSKGRTKGFMIKIHTNDMIKIFRTKTTKIYTLESLNALNKCCDKDTINIQHLGLGLGLSLGM